MSIDHGGADSGKNLHPCPIYTKSFEEKINLHAHLKRSHKHAKFRAAGNGQRLSKYGGLPLRSSEPICGISAYPHTGNQIEEVSNWSNHPSPTALDREEHTSTTPSQTGPDALELPEPTTVHDPDHHSQSDLQTCFGTGDDCDTEVPLSAPGDSFGKEKRNVAWDVFNFYKAKGDILEPLFSKLTNLKPSPALLSDASRDSLQFCMRTSVTLGEAQQLGHFLIQLERWYEPNTRHMTTDFMQDSVRTYPQS